MQTGIACSVCNHPDHDEINTALVTPGRVFPAIAAKYGLSTSALYRHHSNCIPALAQKAQKYHEMLSVESLLAQLVALDNITWGALAKADEQGDIRLTILAIRECRANIQLYAQLGPYANLEERLEVLEQDTYNDNHRKAS